jgi:MFS family permease
MRSRGHLVHALAQAGFRRLYAVRLLGQFGDGVFQASLAGAILFNPERQTRAADVAAGFAVVLVPYSIVGPFAGVLLDRWRRQRVVVMSNIARAAGVVVIAVEILGGLEGLPFYASALVVVSLNRFFLSALSASLPHVVDSDDLVTANALSTTSGTIATTVSGAAAVGVRALSDGTQTAYAAIALTAMVPYLVSAVCARGFGLDALGPDDVERDNRETVAEVAHGLVAGARHLYARRPAFYALVAISAHRLFYGVSTICTVLLYRNYFVDDGVFRAGLGGLAQVVAAVAIGGGIAALVTPAGTRRLGYVRYPALLLGGAAVVEIGLGLPFTMPWLLLAAVLLGLAAQGIKICVDTLVQQYIEDDHRGRVFALYDTMFNLTLVSAAVFTAFALPENGYSPAAVIAIGTGYALTALGYLRVAGRGTARPVTSQHPAVEAA